MDLGGGGTFETGVADAGGDGTYDVAGTEADADGNLDSLWGQELGTAAGSDTAAGTPLRRR